MFIDYVDLIALLIACTGFGGTVVVIWTGLIDAGIIYLVPLVMWIIGWETLTWRTLHGKCSLIETDD